VPPFISGITASSTSSSTENIAWTTNEPATSRVYYATSSSFNPALALSVSNASLVTGHVVGLSGLNANTTYYFRVVSRDASGNVATSTEQSFLTASGADVTAPLLSGIGVTGITTSSASVIWTTNESATTRVYYSTSTPVNSVTAFSYFNAALVVGHAAPLASLLPGTQYRFIVVSADGSGNTATSSEGSFVTATPDVTPPVISGITASSTSSSTVHVAWNTNELATSTVYYSLTSPVNLATASVFSSSTLAFVHALDLTGLTGSSTYYFVVGSTDAFGNTSTSTEISIVTL
jgi:hypothetical protein